MKPCNFSGAPNPRRVHIYPAKRGIGMPVEHIDIMKRENRMPEFTNRVIASG